MISQGDSIFLTLKIDNAERSAQCNFPINGVNGEDSITINTFSSSGSILKTGDIETKLITEIRKGTKIENSNNYYYVWTKDELALLAIRKLNSTTDQKELVSQLENGFKGQSEIYVLAEDFNIKANYSCYIFTTKAEATTFYNNNKSREKIVILKQPETCYVPQGTSVTIPISAYSELELTYQWYIRNKKSTNFSKSSITSSSYSTTVQEAQDGREIYCEITASDGTKINTNSSFLHIKKDLTITSPTVDKIIDGEEGEKVTATVTAEGNDLIYIWMVEKSNSEYEIDPEQYGPTYTVELNSKNDGQKVKCIVQDRFNQSKESKTFTFKINPPLKETLVISSEQKAVYNPDSINFENDSNLIYLSPVENGTTVKIPLEITGGNNLEYTWYYKNSNSTIYVASEKVKTDTYSIVMTDLRAERKLYCKITDTYEGTVEVRYTKVFVLQQLIPLQITKQPVSGNYVLGEPIEIPIAVTGKGPLTYSWYFKNKAATAFSKSSISDSTYIIPANAENTGGMRESRDGRQIYCIIKDKYGNTIQTDIVDLKMQKIRLTKDIPESVTVAKDEQTSTIYFKVVNFYDYATEKYIINPEKVLTYFWYFKNKAATVFSESSITSNYYSTVMTEERDQRQVYCKITDGTNSISTRVCTMFMAE